MVSVFFGCEKLFFTQLDQSLLQNLHPRTLQPSNLRETEHVTSVHTIDKLEGKELQKLVFHLLFGHSRDVFKVRLCCFTHFLHLMNMESVIILTIHLKTQFNIFNGCVILTPAGHTRDVTLYFNNSSKTNLFLSYKHTHCSLLYRFGLLNILSGRFQLHKFTGSPKEHFLESHHIPRYDQITSKASV